MPSAQIVVTYELDFKGEKTKGATYTELHDLATSIPWTIDNMIEANVYLYDDNYNMMNEDDEFFEEIHGNG